MKKALVLFKKIYHIFLVRFTDRPIIPLVNIDITGKCNSLCHGCIFGADRIEQQSSLDINLFKSLIPNFKKLKTSLVSIGGGEPLLYPNIHDVLKLLNDNEIKTHINTNAILLTEEMIVKIINSGNTNFNISFDHYIPEKYLKIRGVDKAHLIEEGIRNLNKFDILPAINIVVSKNNVKDLEDIVDYIVNNFRVSKIQFIPINNSLVHKEITDFRINELVSNDNLSLRLLNIREKLSKLGIMSNSKFFLKHFSSAYEKNSPTECFAGRLFLTIDSNGSLGPCYNYQVESNLNDLCLFDIVNSDEYKEKLKKVKTCKEKCWDVGTAEPSIRLNIFETVKNMKSVLKEFIRYF